MNRPPALTVTSLAEEQINKLIQTRNKPTEGIRVSVNSKGCSGHSYQIEYADNVEPKDTVVQLTKTKVLIDPKALLFLIGCEIDFIEDSFKSGFKFTNPNSKHECSCGKSFGI